MIGQRTHPLTVWILSALIIIGGPVVNTSMAHGQERSREAQAGIPVCPEDPRCTATYGSIELRGGFTPDPFVISVSAGGNVSASSLNPDCPGSFASAPDFWLIYAHSSLPLVISALSNSDTTLMVSDPSGRWFCDDDSGGGFDPRIVFEHPQSGRYDIWIGTIDGAIAPAELHLSEVLASSHED